MSTTKEEIVKPKINLNSENLNDCGILAIYSDVAALQFDEDGDQNPIYHTIMRQLKERQKKNSINILKKP